MTAASAATSASRAMTYSTTLAIARPVALVLVTSDKCYENQEWAFGYRETDRLGGSDLYSASKAAAEIVANSYRRSFFPPDALSVHGIAVATARAGNVIGGGDWCKDRLLPDVVRAMAAGQSVRIRNPRSVRPWQHVLEPLVGYLLLAAKQYARAMADFDSRNLSHDFVRVGVDDADVVAGGVSLNDPNLANGRWRSTVQLCTAHPCGQSLPLGIVLRFPVFAAIVDGVAARSFSQGMQQQPALGRVAGKDSWPDYVEVLARFFIAPGGASRRKRLQAHRSAG